MRIYKIIKDFVYKYRGKNENSIDYDNAMLLIKENKDAILVDVRSKQEYMENHIKKSINIPLYDIKKRNYNIKDKDKIIILYCQYGERSKKAIQLLKRDGYKNVYQIEGGINMIK